MKRRIWGGMPVLLLAILVGCASSLPPVQPATSFQMIAGKWQGSVTDSKGEPLFPATLVIKADGTFTHIVPGLNGSPFAGTIAIEDGKFEWRDPGSGGKGHFELHEGNGIRVLTSRGDGPAATAEYKPAN
jgi:hypothetical protein